MAFVGRVDKLLGPAGRVGAQRHLEHLQHLERRLEILETRANDHGEPSGVLWVKGQWATGP